MARKGWNALSSGYRERLEKAGITQREYEAGSSIQSARGHATTPERPTAANPQRHAHYLSERNRLINTITRKKQDYFGTSPMWNPSRAARAFKDKPPAMAKLRFWSQMDEQDWLHAIREDPTAATYLGYH